MTHPGQPSPRCRVESVGVPAHEARPRHPHQLVGDQRHLDLQAIGDAVQDLLDGVKDQASYLTQVVEDAFKGVTSTQGTVESVTSVASEQYASALAAASSVLFGEEPGMVEKGVDGAKERYEQVLGKLSGQFVDDHERQRAQGLQATARLLGRIRGEYPHTCQPISRLPPRRDGQLCCPERYHYGRYRGGVGRVRFHGAGHGVPRQAASPSQQRSMEIEGVPYILAFYR